MSTSDYYATLVKPFFSPPPWIFAPVWTILYIIIAVSFGYVCYLYFKKLISFSTTLPFIANLIFNLIYSPVAFGLHNLLLATFDILLVLSTLLWLMIVIYKKVPWVAYVNTPYLLWVTFATVLQVWITFLNI